MTNALLQTLAVLLAASVAVAAVVSDAQQVPPKSCKTLAYGYLAVKPFNNFRAGNVTYAGIVKGVNKTGVDGHADSLVITADAKGAPLKPQEWEFAACDYATKLPPPSSMMKKNPPNVTVPIRWIKYGVVRPRNSTQHLLSLTNKNILTSGKQSSVVDSTASKTPWQYSTWLAMRVKLQENSFGYLLTFANRTLDAKLGTSTYKRLLYTKPADDDDDDDDDDSSPDETVQLVLLPPFVVDKKKAGDDDDDK